jgi:GNAT superfamily N-acetyltransferase
MTSTGELTVAAVEPADEAAIRQWYELRCAVARADLPEDPQPCWTDQLGRFRVPWPGEDETVWLARYGDAVVGGCLLALPTRDNLDNAAVDVLVAPEHRRRGIGRALLAHLTAVTSRHGRVRLLAEVIEPFDAPSPGTRFAAASGAQRALVETRRRLDVGSVEPAVLDRLRAEALQRARGYSVVQWLGDTPQRRLGGVAYLIGRMSVDTPLDDLKWGPEATTASGSGTRRRAGGRGAGRPSPRPPAMRTVGSSRSPSSSSAPGPTGMPSSGPPSSSRSIAGTDWAC